MIEGKAVKFFIIVMFLNFVLIFTLHISTEAKPVTHKDPLVTLSYIDKRLAEMNKYIDSKLVEQSRVTSNSSNLISGSYVFKILNVPAGTMIYFADSAECIVRAGKLLVIASKSGGLVDLSDGTDLSDGVRVPNNHLILNPYNDGRGMVVMEDAWVMIRGEFSTVTN